MKSIISGILCLICLYTLPLCAEKVYPQEALLAKDASVLEISFLVDGLSESTLHAWLQRDVLQQEVQVLFKTIDSAPIPYIEVGKSPKMDWNFSQDPLQVQQTDYLDYQLQVSLRVSIWSREIRQLLLNKLQQGLELSLLITFKGKEGRPTLHSSPFLVSTLAAFPSQQVPDFRVRGGHKAIFVDWAHQDTVQHTNGKVYPVRKVILYVVDADLQEVDLAASALQQLGQGRFQLVGGNSKTLRISSTRGALLLNQEGSSPLSLDLQQGAAGVRTLIAYEQNGQAVVSDLQPQHTYYVMAQYEDGVVQTPILSVVPVNSLSMSEYYGEKEGEPRDLRCFILSAAYGSVLDTRVDYFRQFRDQVLLTSIWGEKFVAFYYYYSPPIARWLAHSPRGQRVAQICLAPVLGLLMLWAHFPYLFVILSGLLFCFIAHFTRVHVVRRFVH